MPYCDIIIGNEAEAEAWGTANGLADPKDLTAVARAIASQPKSNASRPRTVIITHGPKSTTVVNAADPENAKVFPVTPLSDAEIVDTNGAGDAFAGGLLGGLVLGKSIDEAIEGGHKLGAMCVQQVRVYRLGSSVCPTDWVFLLRRSALSTSGPRFRSTRAALPTNPF